MLDFYSQEIKSKVLSRFTELIQKPILPLSYKFKVGSKLDSKKLMVYLLF